MWWTSTRRRERGIRHPHCAQPSTRRVRHRAQILLPAYNHINHRNLKVRVCVCDCACDCVCVCVCTCVCTCAWSTPLNPLPHLPVLEACRSLYANADSLEMMVWVHAKLYASLCSCTRAPVLRTWWSGRCCRGRRGCVHHPWTHAPVVPAHPYFVLGGLDDVTQGAVEVGVVHLLRRLHGGRRALPRPLHGHRGAVLGALEQAFLLDVG